MFQPQQQQMFQPQQQQTFIPRNNSNHTPAGLTVMLATPQPPSQMIFMSMMQEENAQRAHERHQRQMTMLAFSGPR